VALALFSVVRLAGPGPEDAGRRTLRCAVLLAPAVGLVLGLAGAGAVKLGRIAWTDGSVLLVAALAGLVVVAALSAGQTFAGLAAAADGLAAGGRREAGTRRRATVAALGPLGGAGVVAVVFTIAGQAAALQACIMFHRGTLAIVLATVVGRAATVLVCAGRRKRVSDAPESRLAGVVAPWMAAVIGLALVAAAGLAGRFDIDGGRVRLSVHAILAACVGLAAAAGVRWWLARTYGGVTVATIGAAGEVAALAVLLVLAARMPAAVTIA
jgi:cobalamin synthase